MTLLRVVINDGFKEVKRTGYGVKGFRYSDNFGGSYWEVKASKPGSKETINLVIDWELVSGMVEEYFRRHPSNWLALLSKADRAKLHKRMVDYRPRERFFSGYDVFIPMGGGLKGAQFPEDKEVRR